MQFRVVAGAGVDTSYNPAGGGALRTPMVRLVDPVGGHSGPGVTAQKTRQLTLNEVMSRPTTVDGIDFEGGPLEILVNNTHWSGKDRARQCPPRLHARSPSAASPPATRSFRRKGETEVWEIVNLTADAHPIHLHLVQFQLINRQSFDVRQVQRRPTPHGLPGGAIVAGFGPPHDYNVRQRRRRVGGNPDVTSLPEGPRQAAASRTRPAGRTPS